MELGGCLRMKLCEQGHEILELAPTQVKKMFTGQGKSTKDDMYERFKEWSIPLFDLLGLKESKYKHVPHPLEDMVDAIAVAIGLLALIQ